MTGGRWKRGVRAITLRPIRKIPKLFIGGSVARQDFHNEEVQQIPPTLDVSRRLPADLDTAAGFFGD